jgi:hypothetical protein
MKEFGLADKAYYVAEYLTDLMEFDKLVPLTVCEKYKHTRPAETGFVVTPESAIAWARELSEALNKQRRRTNKRR